ncbi:MAG: SufS family cysteine desulfurase [Mycetocola sp.]
MSSSRDTSNALPPLDLSPITDTEALQLRNDFPILDQDVNGHRLVYLDSGATSQKPMCVLEDEQDFYEQHNAAVHRGAHTLAADATELFENARETVARFVGVTADELVWTSNATEGINLVAYAIGNASAGRGGPAAERFRIGEGDEIVVTEGEHHANLVPWQELAARTGATLRHLLLEDDGTLNLDQAAEIIGERTRIVAFTHISNVTGVINPVEELVALAHGAGALVLLDACQSAPHRPLDLRALDVDFAVFSGHKMLAPTGIGALYGRAELLNALPPFLTGGSMITTVTLESSEYMPAPQRFEAGTQRVSQAIAFASAVGYLSAVGMERIDRWEAELGQRLLSGFEAIDGVRVLGPGSGTPRAGLVSVDVDGVHAHDVGQYLDSRGIAVRVGHHCAQPLHRRFGVTASTRASAYLYNTTSDIDAVVSAMGEVRGYFGVK